MIGKLRRYVRDKARAKRFKAMLQHFDDMEAEARQQHKAVEPIRAARRHYVNELLRGAVARRDLSGVAR